MQPVSIADVNKILRPPGTEDSVDLMICQACFESVKDCLARSEEACRKIQEEKYIANMKLCAVSVNASHNTREAIKGRLRPEHPYWSTAYADVCNAIDREMALREELEKLKAKTGKKPFLNTNAIVFFLSLGALVGFWLILLGVI
jgi:hypothetical protein